MATTYYITTTGLDTNPGTSAAPWATIGHADSVVAPGDTVIVLAGTYTIGSVIRTNTSGTSTNPITYKTQVQRPWLNPGGASNTILSSTIQWTDAAPYVWQVNGNYIIVEGFEMTGATPTGWDLNGASNCKVIYNYIHDLGTAVPNSQPGAGVFDYGPGGSTQNEIAYNVINTIGIQTTYNQFTHGIYPSGSYDFIHHNIISNCSGWGIHSLGDVFGGVGANNHQTVVNNLCFRNVFGGLVFATGDSSTTDYMYAANNIMINNGKYGAAGYGIKEAPNTGTHSIYAYNLTYGNSGGGYSLLNGLIATHQILVTPNFINYQSNGSGDYHPLSPGPTIDSGTGALAAWTPAQFTLTVDLDGNTLPQGAGYDVGPYEHYVAPVVSNKAFTGYVGGTQVNVMAGTLNVTNQIGQRSTGGIGVWGPLGTLWQYGTQVQVYDSTSALVYSGFVHRDKASRAPGARQGVGYLEHDLELMDNCYKADKRVIWYSNTNVSAGSIVKDLVNKILAQEGVSYTSASIATGVTVPEVIWNGKTISYCLNWLAKNSGYWWNIDINSVLWFQPYVGLPAPYAIDGTQVDSYNNLSVTAGNEMFVNTQYTKGGFNEKGTKAAPLDETFKGNGTTRSFTLSYQVSRIFQVKLNGVDVTALSLTKGSTGGEFYYAPSDAVIAQDTSYPVLTSTDTLEVKYAGRVPAIGKAQSAKLITTQKARESGSGSGIVENVYSDTKVHTVSSALEIASALLAHYGADMTVLEFDTLQTGFMEGQMLTVTLPDFGLTNAVMLITSVNISDGETGFTVWYHIQAVGSPYDAAQFQTFWQNLMNQSSDPSDLSDTSDEQFTPIVTSTFSDSPSFTTHKTYAVCNICNTGTLCNTTTIVC